MPMYPYACSFCKKHFEVLCSWEESGLVVCPDCQNEVDRVVTMPRAVIFKEPKGTSFEDKFDYVAQWNMDNAKEIRRQAEARSGVKNPYNEIDDISSGEYFGEVK